VLGLIFIFVVAKPISFRRLSLLFVVTLVTTRCLYGVMHVESAQTVALATATALTIFAWMSPLVRAVWNSVKARRLAFGALDSASGIVQCTYGSVLAALLLTAYRYTVNPMQPLTLGMLLPTWIAGAVIGLVLLTATQSFSLHRSRFRKS
jgi:hypothetical protein